MPIPKPSSNEPEAKFMSRCMSNSTMNKEYPDQKQRAAVCMQSWKDKKESVTVTIDEDPEAPDIKDFDYEISLGTENRKSIITNKIIGKLDAIILFSDKKCNIKICFDGLTDIIVYKDMEHEGLRYIPVRLQTITPKAELLLSGSAKFTLNNALEIIVEGPNNTNVGVTLRCHNA